MRANRTGENNPPPKIEVLGDGTFYYNFDVVKSKIPSKEGIDSQHSITNWDYNQVRCYLPVNLDEIQSELSLNNYNHTVKLNVNEEI